MPGWVIIIIVFAILGAIIGIFSSMSKDSNVNAGQGCLGGALAGGVGGIGCLAILMQALVPLAIAFLIICWLMNGCS